MGPQLSAGRDKFFNVSVVHGGEMTLQKFCQKRNMLFSLLGYSQLVFQPLAIRFTEHLHLGQQV